MARSSHRDPIEVRVHHAGDASVDGILRLIEIAGGSAPLADTLSHMCGEIAAITGADVVSIYVREHDPTGDVLTMRGNHGFPRAAIGTVRLELGEGLTGLAAEWLRPVSVAVAADQAGFRRVPGLDEDRFPAYLGVPLSAGGRAVGVVVLQRRTAVAFSAAEVALATALGAPVALALERGLGPTGTPRSARLDGTVAAPGCAVARAAVLPTLAALVDRGPIDVTGALTRLPAELERAVRRVRRSGDAEATAAAASAELLLLDARLHERLAAVPPTAAGLWDVARDYARAPFRVAAAHGGDAATQRASDVEDLLVVVWALASGATLFPPGAIWVADRVGGLIALLAAARDAGALVVEGVAAPAAIAIARAEQVPLVTGVRGLHAWIRSGDRCAVEARTGQTGTVRVNPRAVAFERARRDRDR